MEATIGYAELVAEVANAARLCEDKEAKLREETTAFDVKVGDRREIQGLVRRPELNGEVVTLLEWHQQGRRWTVRIEGGDDCTNTISVRPENLWVLGRSSSLLHDSEDRHASGASGCTSIADQLLEARRMLQPGALFLGDIVIPGMPRGDKEEYRLYVSHIISDEMDRPVLVGRHRGYGDEQACDLLLTVEGIGAEQFVQLEYSDYETVCSGRVDAMEGTISGQVSQLMHGDDGFYFPSKDVTHVFSLRQAERLNRSIRLDDVMQCIVLRHEYYMALESLVIALDSWGRGIEAARDQVVELLVEQRAALSRINWQCATGSEGVLEEFANLAEELCAKLRRQATLVGQLQFSDVKAKRVELLRLQKRGLSRQEVHKSTDNIIQRFDALRKVARHQGARVGEEMLTICGKVQYRLHQSFERFDTAMRAAEARPTLSAVQSWRRCRPASCDTPKASAERVLCMICMVALYEEPEEGKATPDGTEKSDPSKDSLMLPCGHCFHGSCVSAWLHRNAHCPCCRLDVSEKVNLDEAEDALSRTEVDRQC